MTALAGKLNISKNIRLSIIEVKFSIQDSVFLTTSVSSMRRRNPSSFEEKNCSLLHYCEKARLNESESTKYMIDHTFWYKSTFYCLKVENRIVTLNKILRPQRVHVSRHVKANIKNALYFVFLFLRSRVKRTVDKVKKT
jgi:hypothetical protein